MKQNHHSRLFKLTTQFIKFFLLAIFGFGIVCILSMSFGVLSIVAGLLPLLGDLFYKFGILLLCLIIITAVLESLR